MNIRRFSLSHCKTVMNIRRFSLSHCKKVVNIRRFSLCHLKNNEYSKVFALPLQATCEYLKVFGFPLPLQTGGESLKCFPLSSGLLGPFGPHQARARGSSCGLLRRSGLEQASGTPLRMLAGARTTLQTKRASRSQLSQVS